MPHEDRDELRPSGRRLATLDQVIGQRVRYLRLGLGLTQEELANMLEGVPSLPVAWKHRQTVGMAEQGHRRFSAEDLVGLSAFFGVPLTSLLEPSGSKLEPERDLRSRADVRVGRVRLSTEAFSSYLKPQMVRSLHYEETAMLDEPEGVPRRVLGQLAGKHDRPWSRRIRKGEAPWRAYLAAREEHLKRRSRFPGPTVIQQIDGEGEWGFPTPPWGAELKVALRQGEPYTARDEVEAIFFTRLLEAFEMSRARKRGGKNQEGGKS